VIVRICLEWSDRAIRAAIEGGTATLPDLAAACRAGERGGACLHRSRV
jgi:bacterioferritin-associated ferredoxin